MNVNGKAVSVSVIMPAYNVGRYVKAAIESVLAQTYEDFELIVCVNPSEDKTAEVCAECAAADSRVRVIPLPERLSPGRTRNVGLEAAGGEYIYFMDSDDIIAPDTLEKTIGAAALHDCDMVVFGYRTIRFDDSGSVVSDIDFVPGLEGVYTYDDLKKNFETYLETVPYSVCSRIFRRRSVRDVRFESRMTAEDAMFNLEVLKRGFERIYFSREVFYTYRARPRSVMGTYNPKRFENEMTVLKKTEELIGEWGADARLEKYMMRRYVNCFLQEYNNFTFDGCGLTNGEAAALAEKMFGTAELRRAAECIPAKEIPQLTARLCYRLSLMGHFRTAVAFKRVYIPISFRLAKRKFGERIKTNHEN